MKLFNKYFILTICLLLAVSMSSCLEDKEDLYDKVGAVATIPVFNASKTAPAAGETITLSLRYYSPDVAVKELQLNETIATDEKRMVTSKPVTDFNTANSYVDSFEYTVPADASKKRIVLEVAAVSTNDLSGTRTLTLNIP